LALRLPLIKGHTREIDRFTIDSPVDVSVEFVFVARPVASEQRGILPIDNVVLKRERKVIFGAGSDNLRFSCEGEDIVPHEVLLSVVLVKAAALGPVDDVVFDQLVGTSLIRIDAPSAVAEAVNIVNSISYQFRSRLDP